MGHMAKEWLCLAQLSKYLVLKLNGISTVPISTSYGTDDPPRSRFLHHERNQTPPDVHRSDAGPWKATAVHQNRAWWDTGRLRVSARHLGNAAQFVPHLGESESSVPVLGIWPSDVDNTEVQQDQGSAIFVQGHPQN